MSGILRLESLTKGNTLKQGDKTPLKYRLFDADGEKLNIAGKTAKVRLVYPDFLTIGYEKGGLTVAQDDTVTFTIDTIIPSKLYHVEIIVDEKFIFPSRADESKFTVDKSSLGTESSIIEIVGVDAVVRKAVDLINVDPSLIIDEDKLVSDIISNTGIGNIDKYYKAFNDLKPKAEQSITKSAEALTKSQNALNVANGIDAKATHALSLSKSADTLSKSVQEQFNQVVINGDSSVEAAQARVDASGQTNPTLKARLDKEHNEVTAQLAQTAKYVNLKDFPRLTTETDDTGRIKRAVVSCREGDTLLAQKENGPYYISDSISISKKINIRFENPVVYTGQKDRPAVIVKGLEFNEVYFLGIYDKGSYPLYGGGYHGWESENYIGLLATNCKECDILVKNIYGFTVAHKSQAAEGGGHWFNNIYIKRTLNNKIGIEMNSDGDGSWMNGNYFYELSNGFSGTDFNADTSQKYTILQTMTSGNKYGGNSNVFRDFKFEIGTNSPDNWTQIYLKRAISFNFNDYRYENNKQGGNIKFCVIDLSDIPTTETWQGARNNVLKPFSIVGYGHSLEFINYRDVNMHWSNIIKFADSEKSEIFRRDDIVYDYRRLNTNYHVIRGLYRRPINNTELLGDVAYEYFPGDVVDGNSVEVRGSFPIVAYIKNLKKGDEIEVLVNAKNGNSSTTFMPFSNGEPIPGGVLNDSKVISLAGSYSSVNSYFSLSSRTIPKIFTVTEDGVDTVAVMLIGDIIGFSIKSNNRNNYVETSSSPDLTLLKDYISTTMPTLGDEGYWKYGEIVYNSNKSSGVPIGWQYKGNNVWESIGNRT